MPMLHYVDFWIEYAEWHAAGGGGGPAPALAVLNRGRQTVASNVGLHLAVADLQEAQVGCLGAAMTCVCVWEEREAGRESSRG